MAKRTTRKRTKATKDQAVVGTIKQDEEPAGLRHVTLTSAERPVVLEGLRLLDRRLEKLLKQKMPTAIREEVTYWRTLATGKLRELVDVDLPDDALLELLALDRTSRLIIRGAVDVYATNERAIVPMLQGLGKSELADSLNMEASRWESETRPKLVEQDNLDLFEDQNDDQEDEER